MALVATTLTAAISGFRNNNIGVASSTGFAAGQPVKIDNEYMYVVSVPSPTAISVRSRGAEGTGGVPHDVNAPVITSAAPSDFPAIAIGQVSQISPIFDDVVTIGQDATITVPLKNTIYNITKGSICNITLSSGTLAQTGISLTFVSNTAFAHVVTYAAGFLGGVNTVATFPAKIGATLFCEVGVNGLVSATVSTTAGTPVFTL